MDENLPETEIKAEIEAESPKAENPDKGKAVDKAKKKLLWQFLFVAVNIAVVIVIATVDFGGDTAAAPFSDVWAVISQQWYYFAGAIALAALFILLDTSKLTVMIRSATKRTNFGAAYKCSQLGRYYDNVTPFGTGGQPFQINYLTQKGIEYGKAMACVLTTFIIQQLAFTFMGPFFLIRYCMSADAQTLFIVLGWIGYAIYLAIPLVLVLTAIKPSIIEGLAGAGIKLLTKMRIIKNPEKASARMRESLDRYHKTSAYLVKNPLRVLVVFAMSIIQFAIYFGIPYFVCRALGATAAQTVDLFSRMVIIYFAITIVPTPGNSIAAEFSFLAVFSTVLGPNTFWGILFWRLLVFYVFLIQGLAIIISRAFNKAGKAHKELY